MFHILALGFTVLFLSIAVPQVRAYGQQSSEVATDDRARGIQLYDQGNYKEAAEALRLAVKQRKDDADAWYYLGLALNRAGDVRGAGKAFQATVDLRPDNAGALTGLAYALLLTNKLSEAEREARRALALNPQYAEAHYIIGVKFLKTGALLSALDETEAALKIEPNLSTALLLKSQILINIFTEETLSSNRRFGDDGAVRLKAASESLENFLRLSPNVPDADAWREQLESLRVYAELSDKSNPARSLFNRSEVTIPMRVLSKSEPMYTEEARRAGVVGRVVMLAVFAADGKVKHILLLQSLGYGMTQQSIKAALKIKFAPAIKDGLPVSQVVRLEYNFHLF